MLKNNQGLTLFELLIALGISSIVGFVVSTELVQSRQQEKKITVMMDLDSMHLASVERAHSIDFWRTALNMLWHIKLNYFYENQFRSRFLLVVWNMFHALSFFLCAIW